MKKWLLISSIINISILLIPLSFEIEKAEIAEKIRIGNIILTEKENKTISPLVSSKNQNFVANKKVVEEHKLTNIQKENFFVPQTNNENNNPIESTKIIEKFSLNTKEEVYVKEESREEISSNLNNNNKIVETGENETSFYENNQLNSETNIPKIDSNLLGADLVKDNSELKYKILNMPNPEYPFKAKNLSFNKKIIVVSEFIVGKDGRVKEFILKSENELYKKYAFDKSIEKILKEYKFTPINYRDKIVEVKFIKVFEFN